MLAVKTANAISTKKRFIGSPFEDCTSQTASGRQDEFGVSIADIGGIIRKIQQIDSSRIEHEIQNTRQSRTQGTRQFSLKMALLITLVVAIACVPWGR